MRPTDNPVPVEIRPVGGFKLFIRFEDGREGTADLAPILAGPMFESIRDPVVFSAVTLDPCGAPCWPTGVDLAP